MRLWSPLGASEIITSPSGYCRNGRLSGVELAAMTVDSGDDVSSQPCWLVRILMEDY